MTTNTRAESRQASDAFVNLVSQVAGLVQYGLLILLSGADATTDFLFLLIAWFSIPLQTIIAGVAYPLLLRGQSVRARMFAHFATLLTVGAGLVPFWILNAKIEQVRDPWVVFCLGCVHALAVARASWLAYVDAAKGETRLLAAVTLFSSLGGIIGVACAALMSQDGVLGLLVGAVGCQVVFVALLQRRRDAADEVSPTEVSVALGSDWGWYLGKSFAGYGAGLGMQSLAAALPPSALTVFSLAQRLVGGVSGLFSNTVLPRLVHSGSRSASPAVRAGALLASGLGFCAVLWFLVSVSVSVDAAVLGTLGLSWMAASLFAAGVQRAAYRFLPAHSAIYNIGSSALIVAAVSLLVIEEALDVSLLVAAVILLDLVPGVIYAWKLGSRGVSVRVGVVVCLPVALSLLV